MHPLTRNLTPLFLCLLAAPSLTAENAQASSTRIPPEFQGHWALTKEQCETTNDAWLNLTAIEVRSYMEAGWVVSIRHIGPNEIELDLSWKYGRQPPKGRTTQRYALSPDGKTLSDTTNGKGLTRIKCDP